MRHLTLRVAALCTLLALSAGAAPSIQAQDCTNLVGRWTTNTTATVNIDQVDSKTGRIQGSYQPASLRERKFPLTGFVNAATEKGKDAGHYAVAVSFAVSFQEFGGITAWTGTCQVKDGVPTLETEDLIVAPNADAAWAHVIANHDTLVPLKPKAPVEGGDG